MKGDASKSRHERCPSASCAAITGMATRSTCKPLCACVSFYVCGRMETHMHVHIHLISYVHVYVHMLQSLHWHDNHAFMN